MARTGSDGTWAAWADNPTAASTNVPTRNRIRLLRAEQQDGNLHEMADAVGRGVEYYDRPAVRKITREAAADNYRWSSLIAGIVRSMPFSMGIVKSPPSDYNVASSTRVHKR